MRRMARMAKPSPSSLLRIFPKFRLRTESGLMMVRVRFDMAARILYRDEDQSILESPGGIARDRGIVAADERVAQPHRPAQLHAVADDARLQHHAAADVAVVPDDAVAEISLQHAARAANPRAADGARGGEVSPRRADVRPRAVVDHRGNRFLL